jgi:hypothetical protein
MNVAVGCQIGLSSMSRHQETYKKYQELKCADRKWGWDRPSYQNPRLESQRGMFVYPYDYPERPLQRSGESWLVQNLNSKEADFFNLGEPRSDLPAQRIRIASRHAESLSEHLSTAFCINRTTIYERYGQVSFDD